MKRTFYCAIPALMLAFGQQGLAGEVDSLCQDKVEAIQKQLRIAEEYGNEHRVRGLKKGLENVQRHCTNDSVIKDAEEDVSESMTEVKERQEALSEARSEGDSDDIRKLSKKLEEAVTELRERQDELESLQGEQ
ncbi:DUF1090 domain-containing protein [Halomonas sp. I1]|uniref:DUF1090 domain-containing protein n=1 Tax=Halomonas sp. I1 TaxID=393536 RepID=UPI0028E05F87|nr:DUF1090 domain-containing protein [Halomonas sp. I1]MDT8893700.1 DUF1090 domain-containing protein [Halomonas sp. I1]